MTILHHCKSSVIKVNFNKNPARVIINGHGFMVDGSLLDMKLFHRTSSFNQCREEAQWLRPSLRNISILMLGSQLGMGGRVSAQEDIRFPSPERN